VARDYLVRVVEHAPDRALAQTLAAPRARIPLGLGPVGGMIRVLLGRLFLLVLFALRLALFLGLLFFTFLFRFTFFVFVFFLFAFFLALFLVAAALPGLVFG